MSGWHIFWLVVGVIYCAGCIWLAYELATAPSEEDLW